MRKFEIVVLKYGSLEKVKSVIIEASNVDKARELGTDRYLGGSEYPLNKFFVGAQNV